MPTDQQRKEAAERLDHIADVYWGVHTSLPADHPSGVPDQIVERVLADYALVGKVPIDALKKRAQERVKAL